MNTISIVPVEGGWLLRSDVLANELFFKSGSSAESSALRLAKGLADASKSARVEIYLRDGTLGQRFTVPALRLVAGAQTSALDVP